MTNWTPQLVSNRPRYLAIAEAMRSDLLAGVLKPGDQLPTHRELAYRLGVTTGTVTRGYAEAEKLGILVGEVGRGSFLRAPDAQVHPFRATSTDDEKFVNLSQASPPLIHEYQDLDRALHQIMASPSRIDLLDYTPPDGHALHRAMGVTWLRRSGIVVPESQVVVTSGAHAGLISCLSALSQHGERVFAEGLNYPTIKTIARHLGLTLVPLEGDNGGLVPEALERAARAGEARILYVVPTLHNPTTSTLSLERRVAIVDIARRYGITIVEDDIFRLLDPRLQPPTLYAMAPERTYHITSVSKTLAPGLRVGFLAAPVGKADQLIRQQTVASGRVIGLAAEVARYWIEGDTADKILGAVIAENAARRAMAIEVFKTRKFDCKPGAPYIWLKLTEQWQPGDFARAAQDQGIRISPGTAFAIDRRTDDHAVRLCFGGSISRENLHRSFVKLNVLLDEIPGDQFHGVA